MKKIIFILIVLLLIATFSSCGKAYKAPLEHYILQGTNDKWVFSKSSFGIDLHRPNYKPYWYRIEKIGDFRNGFIIISQIEYSYFINKDTVRLYENYSDVYPDTLKYTLIYDRSQVNFPGIFIKQ